MPRVKTKQIERACACEKVLKQSKRMVRALNFAEEEGGVLHARKLRRMRDEIEELHDDTQSRLDEIAGNFTDDDFDAFHNRLAELTDD